MAGAPPVGEGEFRDWLAANAAEVLASIGVAEGRTVLDYGCGRGGFAIAAARIVGANGKVYALDVDANALKALRRDAGHAGLHNIRTALPSKSDPPAAAVPGPMDVILLYDVLQLVDDKRPLLRALARMLKPDGVLSAFPMHIGTEKMLELASEDGLLRLRDRRGMLLNFTIGPGPTT